MGRAATSQLGQARIASVEEKLNTVGAADKRVQLLRTIPGVGPRLAEAFVALLDQPQRFRKASQVSGYVGMVLCSFWSELLLGLPACLYNGISRGRTNQTADKRRFRWGVIVIQWNLRCAETSA
jgi:transposase IS116/IS110/IS902 family protein